MHIPIRARAADAHGRRFTWLKAKHTDRNEALWKRWRNALIDSYSTMSLRAFDAYRRVCRPVLVRSVTQPHFIASGLRNRELIARRTFFFRRAIAITRAHISLEVRRAAPFARELRLRVIEHET